MMNLEHQKSTTVNVPFRIEIPCGSSSFTIQVPKHFRNFKQFFFSYLAMYGDFYSKQAAEMDLDIDDQLDEVVTFDTNLYCIFLEDDTLYPNTFTPSNTITTPWDFAKAYNAFFEVNKPPGIISLGSFIDWSDIRFLNSDLSLEEWVKTMAINYYNEAYDEAKHAHKLPPSAEKVPEANSFLFPTVLSEDNMSHIGFRIFFAPNVNGYYSTDFLLKDLGFGLEQIGDRTEKNQFRMGNVKNEHYNYVESENQFKKVLTGKPSTFKSSLRINKKNYLSSITKVSIKRRDSFAIENYTEAVNKMFKELGEKTNFRLGIQFDETEKKFTIVFPAYEKFKFLTFVMELDLSQKLGFGFNPEVTRANATGTQVKEESDLKSARDKATALGYDTGPVLICDGSHSSNKTSGASRETMAILYPQSDGVMLLSQADVCNFPVTMSVPNFFTDSSEFIPLQFNLYRFIDSKMLVPLIWKTNAIVQGNFRGISL